MWPVLFQKCQFLPFGNQKGTNSRGWLAMPSAEQGRDVGLPSPELKSETDTIVMLLTVNAKGSQ